MLSPITGQKTILQKGIRWVPLALTSHSRVWPNQSLGVLSAWAELLHTLQCCWLCSSGDYQPLLTSWPWLQLPDSPCLPNIRLWTLSAWEVPVSALEHKSIFCHCIQSSDWLWIWGIIGPQSSLTWRYTRSNWNWLYTEVLVENPFWFCSEILLSFNFFPHCISFICRVMTQSPYLNSAELTEVW